MRRLEDTDSDDTDTAGTNGTYFFSSWCYSDRLILRNAYKRYACPKVHFMKKIEQSARGRSCGHWPMWRAMAKALLSEVGKKISPKDLENFFWDVIARGSEVTATLDQLLDCSQAVRSLRVRSRAVVPNPNFKPVKRSAATTSSDDGDEGEEAQMTASLRLPPRRPRKDEELPLDMTPRPPLHDEGKLEPFSLDKQGGGALSEPTTAEGGGAANEFTVPTASVASPENEVTSVQDLVPTQISFANDCQPDASEAEYAFVICPEDTSLVGVEQMFSDGSGSSENGDATAADRRIIPGASPEPLSPPVQRMDKGVQCDPESALLFETMQREHLLRMEVLRLQRDAFHKMMQDPTGLQKD